MQFMVQEPRLMAGACYAAATYNICGKTREKAIDVDRIERWDRIERCWYALGCRYLLDDGFMKSDTYLDVQKQVITNMMNVMVEKIVILSN